ncbi:MAG TPA: lipid-A-disaccharide synthase [Caulobacteraceae bacterium]|nr:lipid-A-disaccharide synthase [Caulobacteraceae bacterium]
MSAPCIMVVAAEASGDHLGAGLIRALRARLGADARFVGIGGARMAEEGIESPFDIRSLSVLGLFEGVIAWPRVVERAARTVEVARREKPEIAVLIDSWGFTLRVAHRLRGLRPAPLIIKYVAPQVWASRPGRVRTLARAVDRLLSIHAFDAPLFEREGLAVTFVGNPALARDFSGADPAALRARIGARIGDPIVLVLPGSRPAEIDRLLPRFEAAVARLKAGRPGLHVLVAGAETVAAEVAARVAGWPMRAHAILGEPARLEAMRTATVALACSGTVTTELALAGCPMVVAYRLGTITHAVARHLIRTPFITLINVAAGRLVVPEFIQDAATGEALAGELALRLDDRALREGQIAAQNAALEIMRGGIDDPVGAAADAVIAALRRSREAA